MNNARCQSIKNEVGLIIKWVIHKLQIFYLSEVSYETLDLGGQLKGDFFEDWMFFEDSRFKVNKTTLFILIYSCLARSWIISNLEWNSMKKYNFSCIDLHYLALELFLHYYLFQASSGFVGIMMCAIHWNCFLWHNVYNLRQKLSNIGRIFGLSSKCSFGCNAKFSAKWSSAWGKN